MNARRRDLHLPNAVKSRVAAQYPLLDDPHNPELLALASRVYIDYTNYRGERSVRLIQPLVDGLFFGSNEFHTDRQWLLRAVDVDKAALRTFALRDIHAWDVNPDGSRKTC